MNDQQYCVTVLDTSGIQEYVFGSNELKHIISASALVHFATHEWVYETLAALGKTNVSASGDFNDLQLLPDQLDSELVYSGGGNTVLLFRDPAQAVRFTQVLSKKVLLKAPGLEIVVAHSPLYAWDDSQQPLRDAVQATITRVNQRKYARAHSTPLLGISVTADCQFTGQPAVGLNNDGRLVSAEIKAKIEAYPQAESRLDQAIPSGFRNYKDFANNFDQVGEKNSSSFLAVAHIDGNGMGQRVADIVANQACLDNRVYINTIRAFSLSIQIAAQEALRAITIEVVRNEGGKIGGVVPVKGNVVPFRPIVFGGDDVTFVCDGRLGIGLARLYLEKLASYPLNSDPASSLGNLPAMTARAGVAIVKTHFPFSQAYQLASSLEHSAKVFIKDQGGNLSAMDWHFAGSGPLLEIEEIRRREYKTTFGELCMRPVEIGSQAQWRSWKTFSQITQNLLEKGKTQKNKIMALREIARNGPQAVSNFLQVGGCPELLVPVRGYQDSERNGWISQHCTFFDAIEAMDFFVDFK